MAKWFGRLTPPKLPIFTRLRVVNIPNHFGLGIDSSFVFLYIFRRSFRLHGINRSLSSEGGEGGKRKIYSKRKKLGRKEKSCVSLHPHFDVAHRQRPFGVGEHQAGSVAQLDRAPDYGSGGCRFESCRSHSTWSNGA